MVRSWMMSRSSSADAAIMVKKNLPSRSAVGAGEDAQAGALLVQVVGDDEHVFDGAAEPV